MPGFARSTRARTPSRERSTLLGERLPAVVSGGAHAYVGGDEQYPKGTGPILVSGRGCRVRDTEGIDHVEYGSGRRTVEVVLAVNRRVLDDGTARHLTAAP
jgi:glutamate-1-semialdehyde 2,1-aminomutase